MSTARALAGLTPSPQSISTWPASFAVGQSIRTHTGTIPQRRRLATW
jgi:hypothetical protein